MIDCEKQKSQTKVVDPDKRAFEDAEDKVVEFLFSKEKLCPLSSDDYDVPGRDRRLRLLSIYYYAAEVEFKVSNPWFTPARFFRNGDIFAAQLDHLRQVELLFATKSAILHLLLKFQVSKNSEVLREIDSVLDRFFATSGFGEVRGIVDALDPPLVEEARERDGSRDTIEPPGGDQPSGTEVPFDSVFQSLDVSSGAVEHLSEQARNGRPVPQSILGMLYESGKGVPRDRAEAARWYRKAAEQGVAFAQCRLGEMFDSGDGVAKDFVEAVHWFRMAAERGLMPAQFRFGLKCATGDGVTKDNAEAMKWFRRAAEQGHAVAQSCLGLMCLNGEGVSKDCAEAVVWFRKAAEQGNADAQFELGVRYANGDGVPKDSVEAVKWFRKAAEQGNASAQCNLGSLYFHGEGVTKDSREAAKWYREAAEQGHAEAQNSLGMMYQKGACVPKDSAESVKWFRKSAEQGNAAAQHSLGMMYSLGEGVTKDSREAVKWYRKAADQGHAPAQATIGVMYGLGEGVRKDSFEAVRWYRRAAEQGDAWSQYFLGGMYCTGTGVPKNQIEGLAWITIAAASGTGAIVKGRDLLEQEFELPAKLAAHQRSREILQQIEARSREREASNSSTLTHPNAAAFNPSTSSGSVSALAVHGDLRIKSNEPHRDSGRSLLRSAREWLLKFGFLTRE